MRSSHPRRRIAIVIRLEADVSVVIPTYNPQERIFSRVLDAVAALDVPSGARVEYVIVDNRSERPVEQMPCVASFLRTLPTARVVVEQNQGLTFARLAGIRATSGHVMVVFDDDNVPSRGYLRTVLRCARELPWVAVWGAGNIDVELLDPVPGWLRERAKQAHNQRSCHSVQYGCVAGSWQPYYPIGMGQVVRRDVAVRYEAAVEAGELSATDRKAGSFASAGDVQIVWQAIKMGMAAGVHPDLQVTHLIPGSRATSRYMQRLAFGCGISYHPAMVQSFPDASGGRQPVSSAWRDAVGLARFAARHVVRGRVRLLPIDFANLLGLLCGRVMVEGSGTGHWSFKLARRLGLT
jgi:hypothetical protein